MVQIQLCATRAHPSLQLHASVRNTLRFSGYQSKARFPFKRNRLRCVRCVNENRKKRKHLRWQAANHGCHCFDRAFLLAGVCVCCVKLIGCLPTQALEFLEVFVYATQAIAFEWKPGFSQYSSPARQSQTRC